MLDGLNIQNKTVLEPSAGNGNIVDYVSQFTEKEVLTFEKNDQLRIILQEKSFVLGSDFLECTPEMISHIDFIFMNPPFSNADEHILHAFDIAPEGCQIVSLCNFETVNSGQVRFRKRRILHSKIKEYGTSENIGPVFDAAERKTGIDIGLVRLMKPIVSKEFDYEGFYLDEEPEEDNPSGLQQYNEVRAIVQRYIGALKCFDEGMLIKEKMDMYTKPVGFGDGFGFSISHGKTVFSKDVFSKELQKKSWLFVIEKMKIKKFVTSGVMEDINKFVEQQTQIPFTMKNIYKMIELIIGTREQTMNRALCEVFDKLTQHYHENRYQVEGWKTNSHYLVNKKFILDYVVDYDSRWPSAEMLIKYNSRSVTKMNDLNKALCYLMGVDNKLTDLYRLRYEVDNGFKEDKSIYMPKTHEPLQYSTWYDWGFFSFKGYKKGTIHVKFKSDEVWGAFNRKVAEIKGYPLPEKL